MSFNNRSRNYFISFLFIIFLIPSLIQSQVSLTVSNTSGKLGEKLIPLDIKISNLADTIAAFQIWLQLDRPDLVKFQEGAVLARYHYDTSSFIMPSWSADIRSLGATGHDILITSGSFTPPFIIPPQNDSLLIRLYLEVVDSLVVPPTDSIVNIHIETAFIDNFSFTDPFGQSVGITLVEYTDSTCYECTQWVNDTCLSWQKVFRVVGQPIDTSLCDSLAIFLDTMAILDSTFWQFTYGTFTLLPDCGYTNGDFDIGSLVSLVAYMFSGGATKTLGEADYNCDCTIDISDLIGFVGFMFNGGASPGCTTQ